MRMLLKLLVVLVILGIIGGLSAKPIADYWRKRNLPEWRVVETSEGPIVAVVNSTGSIKPVISVAIGSFVSGPIEELFGKFNQEVKKDEVLARIDSRIYRANVARDEATFFTRIADVKRAKAQLQLAANDEERALALRAEDETFISQAEIDKFSFSRASLEAQLDLAKASVDQAEASLEFSQAQLDYTDIRSPVDGIIINRKIDPGQTLAAQFQTPELFVVAPDMRAKMHIHASVDEADIGLIREAKLRQRPVSFTVDAYPDDLFVGEVEEIRLSHTVTQNVVTYPVVVAAPNPDLKLLPGMTASISFEVDRREKVVRIPNAALRFYPQIQHVRDEDRPLLEGQATSSEADDENSDAAADINLSAAERAILRMKRRQRHVWVVEGEKLKALAVITGLSDSHFTEVVEGEIPAGIQLVTGIKPKKAPGT